MQTKAAAASLDLVRFRKITGLRKYKLPFLYSIDALLFLYFTRDIILSCTTPFGLPHDWAQKDAAGAVSRSGERKVK